LRRPGWLRRESSRGTTVCGLLAAGRSSASRSAGIHTMILPREESALRAVYCHEGTELPFGGPATDVLSRIGVNSGDTLNLQWAYLRDQPPPGPLIGHRGAGA